MISSEAQRTLVKSPPELWTELSEPTSLARHLGELGEIRITRVEAESTVEWEGERLSGAVKLEPSGWGTKVTLTINREIPTLAKPVEDLEAAENPVILHEEVEATLEAPEIVTEPATQEEPEAHVEPKAQPEPEALGEPEALDVSEPGEELEPRRKGFFARIFNSLRARSHDTLLFDEAISQPMPEPATPAGAAAAEEPGAAEPQVAGAAEIAGAAPDQVPAPEPIAEPEESSVPDASPDLTAELAAAEEAFAAQDVALLSSVLDRLGAAHHRPFSRA